MESKKQKQRACQQGSIFFRIPLIALGFLAHRLHPQIDLIDRRRSGSIFCLTRNPSVPNKFIIAAV
jgi:hypothetical protein